MGMLGRELVMILEIWRKQLEIVYVVKLRMWAKLRHHNPIRATCPLGACDPESFEREG
jgi:hypothetical protein